MSTVSIPCSIASHRFSHRWWVLSKPYLFLIASLISGTLVCIACG